MLDQDGDNSRTNSCCGGVGAHADNCQPDIPLPAGAETDGWTMTNADGNLVRSLVWSTHDAGIAAVDIDGNQDSTGNWCRGISVFGLEGPARITADQARDVAGALLTAANELDRLNAPDNPYPVDPTGPLTIGGIPDPDLDRMIQATVPATDTSAPNDLVLPVDSTYHFCCEGIGNHYPDCGFDSLSQLRRAVIEVDPALLTAVDSNAILRLMRSALDSGSDWARTVQAADEARQRRFTQPDGAAQHKRRFHDEIAITCDQSIAADKLVLFSLGAEDGADPENVIGDCVECWKTIAFHLSAWLASRMAPTFNGPERATAIEAIQKDIAELLQMDIAEREAE